MSKSRGAYRRKTEITVRPKPEPPKSLSALLAETTATRHRQEHNRREARRVGAHREYAEDDDARPIVGDRGAAQLLPETRPMSRWDCEVAARRHVLEQEQASAKHNYRKLMRNG